MVAMNFISNIKKGDTVLKTKKILLGYLLFSLLAGVGLAVWRTVLLYQYFDPYTNRFPLDAGDSLDAFGYVMLACLILAATSAAFLHGKECKPFTSSSSPISVFASSLLGCIFVAAGTLALVYHAQEIFSGTGVVFQRLLLILALVSIFFSALYFILSASARYDGTTLKKALAFFPSIFAVSYLGAAYLSPDFLFSDSNDVLRNVAIASLIFFFLQETRTCFYGKTDNIRFPFTLFMIICLFAHTLPTLIVTAFWEMEMTYMTMFDLAECGVLIYGIVVAVSMSSTVRKKEPEPMKEEAENTAQELPSES